MLHYICHVLTWTVTQLWLWPPDLMTGDHVESEDQRATLGHVTMDHKHPPEWSQVGVLKLVLSWNIWNLGKEIKKLERVDEKLWCYLYNIFFAIIPPCHTALVGTLQYTTEAEAAEKKQMCVPYWYTSFDLFHSKNLIHYILHEVTIFFD